MGFVYPYEEPLLVVKLRRSTLENAITALKTCSVQLHADAAREVNTMKNPTLSREERVERAVRYRRLRDEADHLESEAAAIYEALEKAGKAAH